MASGINHLSKLYKDEMAAVGSEIINLEIDTVLHMDDPSLDWTIGGFSKHRINLAYGPAGAGKSAIVAMGAAKAQQERPDSIVLLNDTEFYYFEQPSRVERLGKYGIDTDNLMIIPGNTLDDAFGQISKIETLIKEKKVDISAWIIDSWQSIENEAASTKIDENKKGTGLSDSSNAARGNAKQMSPVLSRILKMAAKYKITVFIVQHVLINLDPFDYVKYKLPGGEKLKHYCDSILLLDSVNAKDSKLAEGDLNVEKDDIIVGKKIRAKAEKTRNTSEGKKADFFINFKECRFARPEESLFSLAEKLGVIYTPTEPEFDKKGKPVLDENGIQKIKEKTGWREVIVDETPFSAYGEPKFMEKLKDPVFYKKVRKLCDGSKKMSASTGESIVVKNV